MFQKYKIAIIPEESVLLEMKKRILEYCNEFKIVAPTLSDPHISIKTEFESEVRNVEKISKVLENIAAQTDKFDMMISGIGSFPKREFYYKVESSKDLKKLHMSIIKRLSEEVRISPSGIEGSHFQFKIPFMYGDINETQFDELLLRFESYHPELYFEADNIALLRKEGKLWRIEQRFWLKR